MTTENQETKRPTLAEVIVKIADRMDDELRDPTAIPYGESNSANHFNDGVRSAMGWFEDNVDEIVKAIRATVLSDAADRIPKGSGTIHEIWDEDRVQYRTYEISPRDESPETWLRNEANREGETS